LGAKNKVTACVYMNAEPWLNETLTIIFPSEVFELINSWRSTK